MARMLDPLQFLLLAAAGWINQHQQQTIDYLREENRVLREQLVATDCVSMMTSAVAWPPEPKGLGRKLLAEVATLVTPDTLWLGTVN